MALAAHRKYLAGALAHGSLNNCWQYAFKFTTGPSEISDVLVLGAGGLALVITGTLLLSLALPTDALTSTTHLPMR